MKEKFSVVIPVYNSEKTLEKLYIKIKQELLKITSSYEFIFVDDKSKDNSFNIIEELCSKDDNVIGIKLNKNYGQQNAVFCGLNYASGDYIINMDDDLQHNPKYIKDMYVELKKGYDIVYAVTQVKYHKLYRNIGSKLTDKLFNLLLKKPKDKRVSSYRILKKDLRNLILKEKRAYNYISASILKNTKNIGNIYYEHSARKHGNSNYTFLKQLKIFLRIYLYYSNNVIFKFFLKRNEPYIIEKILNTRKEK